MYFLMFEEGKLDMSFIFVKHMWQSLTLTRTYTSQAYEMLLTKVFKECKVPLMGKPKDTKCVYFGKEDIKKMRLGYL